MTRRVLVLAPVRARVGVGAGLRGFVSVLLPALALAACGDGERDQEALRQWMRQPAPPPARAAAPAPAGPPPFVPFAYGAAGLADPFNGHRLQGGPAGADSASKAVRPDTGRRREPLEAFPLDAIRMVGSLRQGGVTYALLQVDKAVYPIRPGQRVGQNFGLVTGVTEDAVQLRESVQEADGGWVERAATLTLQDGREDAP